MLDISRKTYERNGIKTVLDSDGLLLLNEKHIEEVLDHEYLPVITVKYFSDHRKHIYELADKPNKQPNRIIIYKELAAKVIMDCRATAAHKFRIRLEFKQYDIILIKEQSVLTKIKNSFKGENMKTQYSVLGYKISLYLLIKMDTVNDIFAME